MKANIEVRDRAEATALKSGLEDTTVRACAVVVGMLRQLPSDAARRRVMAFAAESIDEASASAGANGADGAP